MAKTNFIDGNPSLQILGTTVTAAFLNAVNNHRHMGTAVDGDGASNYAADTGAANAYAVALSPALTGHVVGMSITFKALNANTGASTLAVNGLGAVAMKHPDGSALQAGDITAGAIILAVYDGTAYQVIMPSFLASMAANGYQKLPSGWIKQWGTYTTGAGGTFTVTFPVAFPNNFWGGQLTHYAGSGYTYIGSISSYSNSQVVIRCVDPSGTAQVGATYFCEFIGN